MTAAEKWVPVRVLKEPDGVTLRKAPNGRIKRLERRSTDDPTSADSRPAAIDDSRDRKNDASDSWRRYADLFDSGEEYRVLVEIPGVPKEELEVSLTDRNLWIEAATRTSSPAEKGTFVLSGGVGTKILRCVTFPEVVMAERANASLNNGVLEVRVPKKTPTAAAKHRTLIW